MDEDGKRQEEWKCLDNPVVVRFCVKDVVTVFVRVVYEGEGPLAVETVAAFGPRERVSDVVGLSCRCFETGYAEITPFSIRFQSVSGTFSADCKCH